MSDKKINIFIIILVSILVSFLIGSAFLRNKQKEDSDKVLLAEAISIADDWINENTSIYFPAGSNFNLEKVVDLECSGGCYQLSFSFSSTTEDFQAGLTTNPEELDDLHLIEIETLGRSIFKVTINNEPIEIPAFDGFPIKNLITENKLNHQSKPAEKEGIIQSEAPRKINIKLYFSKKDSSSDSICDDLYLIERSVDNVPAIARASLMELFKGPTEAENKNGYFADLGHNEVSINDLRIENDIAYLDLNDLGGHLLKFNDEFWENFSSTSIEEFLSDKSLILEERELCRVLNIKKQIEKTLEQFSTVKEVRLSINQQSWGL